MFLHPGCRARVLAASFGVVAFAVSVAAQSPPAGQAASQAPAGPVRQLSVDEAVKLALDQNLGIQVERINPQLQDLSIDQVRSNYVPVLTSGIQNRSQNQPPNSFFSGAQDKIESDTFSGNAGVSSLLKWGTNVSLFWDSARNETNNIFSTFNPVTSANIDASITQPLLRDFSIDTVRQQLAVTRKNREIADVTLQQNIALTSRSVRNSYWDYVYALNALKVARQSLELAQESLRNTKSRVEIGTLAPIDVVEAESEVASREEAVILAEASIGQTEDRLRSLIFDPKTPDFWAMRLEPTDQAPYQLQTIDVNAAVARALVQRTDIVQTQKRLESQDVNIRYFKNQTLPDLNVRLDYNATGLGGTQYLFGGGGFPPPVVGTVDKSYGDVMKDVFGAQFPTWVFSVNLSYPIGYSNAEASLARTRLEAQQSQIQLRAQELEVVTQVRDAARQLLANSKRVDATRASRTLAERRLEAEQKKFTAGMSTSFLVFQAQRDLSDAQNNFLRAVLEYNKTQVDFETVQIAPLSSVAFSVPSTGGATAATSTLGGAVGAATAGAATGRQTGGP